MLRYEHGRTDKIVQRLRNVEGFVRFVTIATAMALFAISGISVGLAGGSDVGAVIGGIAGGMFGFLIGGNSVIILSAVIEWMCQIVIAQGELIETVKHGRKA